MPIRIRDRSTTEALTTTRTKGQAPGSATSARLATASPAFQEQLGQARRSLAHQDLDRLYLDLEEQGRHLMGNPTPEELRRYKQRVRDFIEYVVKHGLALKSSLSARELHQIVEKVDEELLSLADSFLSREQHVLELGAKIDQINGMLLDLKA